MAIWRMRFVCRIPKATYTHSEYQILTAFPQQQWLHERASMLRHTQFVVLSYIVMGEYIGDYNQDKALNNWLIYLAITVNIPYMTLISCSFQSRDSHSSENQKNGRKMSLYLHRS